MLWVLQMYYILCFVIAIFLSSNLGDFRVLCVYVLGIVVHKVEVMV